MKLKNIMNDRRQLLVNGQVIVLSPGEIIEGDKIIYDRRAFEELNEDDLDLVKKNKIKKENKE